MYKQRCMIVWCTSKLRDKNVIYHRFVEWRRKQWLIALGRNPNEQISSSNRICSRHFSSDSYKLSVTGKPYLKPDAIPTLNLRRHLQVCETIDKPPTAGDSGSNDDSTEQKARDVTVEDTYTVPYESKESITIPFGECKIKNEEVEIKKEDQDQFENRSNDFSTEQEMRDVKVEDTHTVPYEFKESDERPFEECLIKIEEMDVKKDQDQSENRLLVSCFNEEEYKQSSIQNEDQCDDQLNLKMPFIDPMRTGQVFKCLQCDFETLYKKSIKRHMLQHKNLSLYKCNYCDYQTLRKNRITKHICRNL